jgi:hypothetical protein
MTERRGRAVHARVDERVNEWRVAVDRKVETESSIVVFGLRDQLPVVLKVVKSPGDEWRSGAILKLFGGRGVAHVTSRSMERSCSSG